MKKNLDRTYKIRAKKFSSSHKSTKLLAAATAIIGSSLSPLEVYGEEKAKILPTISVIESESNGKYGSLESSLLQFRGSMLETPKTINKVSRQLLDDQNATSMRDALRNVPGLAISAGEGGAQGDNATIRGFSARNDFFIDGMRDFGQYYRDPFNIESIEVVQGPTSVIFGRGSTGGVIAQNSKMPKLETKQSISLSAGTNNTLRATADGNYKINNSTALRLNLMTHHNRFAQRDKVENNRQGFAPSISFGVGTSNRITLSHLYQTENDIPDYGIPWHKNKPAKVSRSNFYGFQDDFLKTTANVSTARFEHDFSDDSLLRNQTRYAQYSRNIRATGPRVSGNLTTPVSALSVSRSMQVVNSVETFFGNQLDYVSKFETGKIKHDTTAGIALNRETSQPSRYNLIPTESSTSALFPSEPTNIAIKSNQLRSDFKAKIDTISAYALDTLHLGKNWDLALGIRFDRLSSSQKGVGRATPSSNLKPVQLSRSDNVFSRNASLTYKINDSGSVYGSYGTSFNPSAETIALTDAYSRSQSMAPEKNEVYEIGSKWGFLKKKLLASLALFHAKKDNARELSGNNSYLATGRQVVDGLQAQLNGNLTEKFSLNAGYSLLNARITKSLNGSQKGNQLINVPMHSLTLFSTYKTNSKLEIGGGANYVSHRYGSTIPVATTGKRNKASGYVVFSALAKYPLTKTAEFQLNINNLFNKNYGDQVYTEHVVPGEGRVFLANLNLKF